MNSVVQIYSFAGNMAAQCLVLFAHSRKVVASQSEQRPKYGTCVFSTCVIVFSGCLSFLPQSKNMLGDSKLPLGVGVRVNGAL